MFCIKCGSELYPKNAVCPNCRFDNTAYVQPPPGPPATYAPYAVAYQASPGYADAYAEGNILVVPPNATLPASCVKCGGVPKEPWLRKTFYWHNPLLYLVVLAGLLVYVIVAMIVQKKRQLMVPICPAHESQQKTKLWIGALMLLGCIPVPVVLATSMKEDYWVGIAVLLGFVMFFAGAITIIRSRVLTPTYIGDDCAKFKGAHPEFLARLKPRSFAAAAAQTPMSQ